MQNDNVDHVVAIGVAFSINSVDCHKIDLVHLNDSIMRPEEDTVVRMRRRTPYPGGVLGYRIELHSFSCPEGDFAVAATHHEVFTGRHEVQKKRIIIQHFN